ncbi:putative major facilitator superfamily transporter [Fonsecaea pedrosoi]|nr:putative major facilitator superfamily transporter [Fonsecaea pedrosoi]
MTYLSDEAAVAADEKAPTSEKTSAPTSEHAEAQGDATELEHIDITNKHAYKADNSDGVIEWSWRGKLSVICLCALYVGAQLPLYFVGGSLSLIAADLNIIDGAAWLGVSNNLAVAAVAPFCGYLQDLFGKRNVVLAGCLLVLAGSVVMGTSHGLSQAAAGMSIEGAGAGILELTSIAGVSEIVPVAKRGLYLALLQAAIIPFWPYIMYAQLLATYSTWRWFGLALVYFPHNHNRAEGVSRRTLLRSFDYLGSVSSIVGLTLFLVAIQSGGYTHPWKSAYVLVTLLLGALLIIFFVVWEAKFARAPIVPREMFSGQRIVALAYCIGFVSGLNFYSILNFFPILMSQVYDPDPVQVGLKGLGYGCCIGVGSMAGNVAVARFRRHHREVLLFFILIMSKSPTPFRFRRLVTALLSLASFGIGGVLVPTATVALTATPDTVIATTVALSLSVRLGGGAIGYSIYYNIFASKLKSKLPTLVAEYAVKAGLPLTSAPLFVETFLTNPAAVTTVSGVTNVVIQAATLGVKWAYAESLKYVWYTSIPFGVLSIIACLFLPDTSKYMTNRISVHLA